MKNIPYEETPGQMSAIADVKRDMESDKPMDRLCVEMLALEKPKLLLAQRSGVCTKRKTSRTHFSRYYFGTTALRIILEANGTIWHSSCRTLTFSNASRTKKILQELQSGKIDIIIGTHRLLQPDVSFRDLGILIIDEEQRFGVKQKKI